MSNIHDKLGKERDRLAKKPLLLAALAAPHLSATSSSCPCPCHQLKEEATCHGLSSLQPS